MSIDMDSTAGAKAATKGSRRTQDDSYAALRDAAEKRRAQNRVAQRNSRKLSIFPILRPSVIFFRLLLSLKTRKEKQTTNDFFFFLTTREEKS
jgi:hypothetical protein